MKTDKASPLAGIILTILSLLLLVGIRTFAASCGVHDDGSVSSCHWAAQAVFGVGVVSVILSIVRIFERDEGERRGLSLAVGCLGVLVACLPGVLIDLCMTQTMRCQTIMRPFCIAVGGAIAIVGMVDLVMRLLKLRTPK